MFRSTINPLRGNDPDVLIPVPRMDNYKRHERFMDSVSGVFADSDWYVAKKLKEGFDPDVVWNGWPALMHAVTHGNLFAVCLLLTYGANPCFYDSDRRTLLHQQPSLQILKELLNTDLKRHVNFQNRYGETAFFLYSLDYRSNKEQIHLLLEAGADASIPDSRGRFPGNP